MSINIVQNPPFSAWESLCQRPILPQDKLQELMKEIFHKVHQEKDHALKHYTEKFDGVRVTEFQVAQEEISQAKEQLPQELLLSINIATANIEKFHKAQLKKEKRIKTMRGVVCWSESRAIEKVGIYIPGGSAPLFSTVLMLAIPAKIAGCKEIVLVTPPNKEGKVHPAILYSAYLSGVTHIFKVGGAQAIAALTLGTPSIPPVYKIFGPGNAFVTAAKQYAQNFGVAIDMPAGPSEVLVIADEDASPAWVAADLLAQAEHGSDSQVILLTTSEKFAQEALLHLKQQLELLPRKEIAQNALQHSKIIVFEELSDCFAFSNFYAPEHLILAIKKAKKYLSQIQNAGSVFVGKYSCETAGDYASGTNHTLPTYGFAKNYSGVSVDSFVKKISFQKISKKGLLTLGPVLETMAEHEQLFAHKNAVTLRLEHIQKNIHED